MTLEERTTYDGSKEALIKIRGNFEDNELNGEGEEILYFGLSYGNENIREERKGTFREGVLREGEIIIYDHNGRKREERKGTFNIHGVLREGEITFYWDGKVTGKEKRPYF